VERRRQVKGPRILGRYDPKIEKHRISKTEEAEHVTVAVRAGVLLSGRRVDTFYLDPPSPDQVVAQRDEPVKVTEGYWLYRDYWIAVEDERSYRSDEIMLLIKRAVLREERELVRARQEVEALERLGDLALATREMIPDDVRMFVWQRDGGKCVRCGGREKLEFDHIIPVADGGSSTERNVQLLCEPCNRSKGRSVM